MSRIEEIFNKVNFIIEDMCMQDFEKFYKIFSISNFSGTVFSCFPNSKSTIFLFFQLESMISMVIKLSTGYGMKYTFVEHTESMMFTLNSSTFKYQPWYLPSLCTSWVFLPVGTSE